MRRHAYVHGMRIRARPLCGRRLSIICSISLHLQQISRIARGGSDVGSTAAAAAAAASSAELQETVVQDVSAAAVNSRIRFQNIRVIWKRRRYYVKSETRRKRNQQSHRGRGSQQIMCNGRYMKVKSRVSSLRAVPSKSNLRQI